jgi:GH35 family endo-1,4-beta-xylanase
LAFVLSAGIFTTVHADIAQATLPDLDQAIRENRMGSLVINAKPDTEVRVKQLRHEFWFGAALASHMFSRRADSQNAAQYKKTFLENFNSAVTENALKWHAMERHQGTVDYSIVEAMLGWTEKHEIPLRGHNIFWGVPGRVQSWQKELDDEALRAVVKARALDVGRRYRGRFAEYDLNNEMMHANYYEDRLGPDITRQMALWVRRGDPQAVLYLNDYDILTGNRLDDFVKHIRGFQRQGVPIDGLGVQGHLHGDTFDADKLQHALDTLAQFKLPIRITEFNFPGQRSKYYRKRGQQLTEPEENAKAKALTDYFRICFAHPAVEGILLWGFWEGANWIPVSSLYRRDWTPTPAAHAYRRLVFEEWWTSWKGKADVNGQCTVPAFFGRYRVAGGDAETIVDLNREDGSATVSLR